MTALRPVDPDADAALLHGWLTAPTSAFWGMTSATRAEVRQCYADLAVEPRQRALIGSVDGAPAFLVELYDPAHSELAAVYDAQDGDLGMHFLVAPPAGPTLHGFTRRVITAVMAHCFSDPAVRRVVVEPDVRNHRVHALNEVVGFDVVREVELPDKRALLSVCDRAGFEARRGSMVHV